MGRALRPNYWREAYNKALRHITQDTWFNIWEQCSSDLSFLDWVKAIGLAKPAVAYYDEKERESLKINIVDGKLKMAKVILLTLW